MIGHLVVRLVTPAMIGGAEPRQIDDPPTLRPPSLRGHLRFWSRALGGKKLAEELWGSVDSGQRVRLLGAQTLTGKLKEGLLIPSREHKAWMIPPDQKAVLRFAIPVGLELPRLQAVLWTWLHLGTVGRRSRRGYGSVQWLPSKDDLLHDWPPLWPKQHLTSSGALEKYLDQGLTRVGSILKDPGRQPRQVTEQLLTLDQVFVGGEIAGKWEVAGGPAPGVKESLELIVHGLNEKARGAAPDCHQLGAANPDRRPSPILWRFFPVPGRDAFLPVMTWFPTGYKPTAPVHLDLSGEVYKYLHGKLGFERSLIGDELAA